MTMAAETYHVESVPVYEDNSAYLEDELRKLDVLLRTNLSMMQKAMQPDQGLYIAAEEIEDLLKHPDEGQKQALPPAQQDHFQGEYNEWLNLIDQKVAQSQHAGIFLGIPYLAQVFNLSRFEVQAFVICLAPELKRSYDRIYAYLQDDITRKKPSVDLILNLLHNTNAGRWNHRILLSPHATLRYNKLLQVTKDAHNPSGASGLSEFLQVDPRILHFIQGHRFIVPAELKGILKIHYLVDSVSEVLLNKEATDKLLGFIHQTYTQNNAPVEKVVIHLQGEDGAGKMELAGRAAQTLNSPLLVLDAQDLFTDYANAERLLQLSFRESMLQQAPLYIKSVDRFLEPTPQAKALRMVLARSFESYGSLIVLGGEQAWPYNDLFDSFFFASIELSVPASASITKVWMQSLESYFPDVEVSGLAPRLAKRFRLAPGKIRRAVKQMAQQRTAENRAAPISFDEIALACRSSITHNLAALATRIKTQHTWNDIVLPQNRLNQLKEMCTQVRYFHEVYDQWGFGKKITYGRGISALFTGPPGTGKTMAAEVIASDLQLDLFKIDLARVVSKYIGETEKNLGRIFEEAENSNVILFFDEADALFGKRTEISDAHDRYANLETSYLLQKMEEYEGLVILASNLRENMDSAFLRRIRFVVEFPFPDAGNRQIIWEKHFPSEAPVSNSIDFEKLASAIQVAGGNIKNIALGAAFFAAEEGGPIEMRHITRSARREYEKIGKLWNDRVFN